MKNFEIALPPMVHEAVEKVWASQPEGGAMFCQPVLVSGTYVLKGIVFNPEQFKQMKAKLDEIVMLDDLKGITGE